MQVGKYSQKLVERNRWIGAVFLVMVWLLIWSLGNDFSRVRKGYARVDEAERRLSEVKKRNSELKIRVSEAETDYYKERIIREKLTMQKPGEMVVVLPKNEPEERETEDLIGSVSNWEKWWNLVKD